MWLAPIDMLEMGGGGGGLPYYRILKQHAVPYCWTVKGAVPHCTVPFRIIRRDRKQSKHESQVSAPKALTNFSATHIFVVGCLIYIYIYEYFFLVFPLCC